MARPTADTSSITIRIPRFLLERAEKIARAKQMPDAHVPSFRNDVLRIAIDHGLTTMLLRLAYAEADRIARDCLASGRSALDASAEAEIQHAACAHGVHVDDLREWTLAALSDLTRAEVVS